MSSTSPKQKSRTPTWVTIVGVLLIVFGALGILHGAQQMVMPQMVEMQKVLIGEMSEFVIKQSREEGYQASPDEEPLDTENIYGAFDELMNFPEWFKTWSPAIGAVSLLVAGFYLFAGVLMLMTKPIAIRLCYAAISFSILWAIALSVIFSMSESTMLVAQLPGNVISIVIDIVLLIVVLSANKDVFYKHTSNAVIDA